MPSILGKYWITDTVIDNTPGWLGSRFNNFCSSPIEPADQSKWERLAQYIARAPISQERTVYVPASEA